MLEPLPTAHDTDRARSIVWHLLAGAVPPLLATIAGLWQLLRPYMPHDHIGMLYIAMITCWIAPMAVVVWCKTEASRQEAKAHAEAAAAERATIIANQNKLSDQLDELQRSLKGAHHRLEKLEDGLVKLEGGTDAEMRHLRKLIVGDVVPVPEQRLGPRSLS